MEYSPSFLKFCEETGIKTASHKAIAFKAWTSSREWEEKDQQSKNRERYEIAQKVKKIDDEEKPDYVFVYRDFGTKWVNNVAFGFFEKSKCLIKKWDVNNYYGSSASFEGVELEQYEIAGSYGERLPDKPYSLKNVFFCDDLIFRRDDLTFSFGETKDWQSDFNQLNGLYGGSIGNLHYAFLKKSDMDKIYEIIENNQYLQAGDSYRFTGEPCYTAARHALPPHERGYKQSIYVKNWLKDSIQERWEWCPFEVKVEMVKLWRKARNADRSGNHELVEELKAQSKLLFPYRIKKSADIKRKQWSKIVKITQLNETAGAINEYHKTN